MIWTVYAIAHSLFRAIFAEINRIYQIDAWQLTFIHAVWAVLILLPLTPFMDWPADPSFYVAAAMVALIFSIGIVIQLNLSSEQSGRISGIAVPLEAVAAFGIWLAIDTRALDRYAHDPLGLLGLGAAFVIAIFGLMMLRRHDINRRTLMVMAPVAVTYAVAGVVTKVVVPSGALMVPALLSFALVNYIVMTVAMGVVLLAKRRVDDTMRSPRALGAGLLTGMLSVMGYATFVAAVVMAPNPGYVSLTAVLVPVWLFIYHHARDREDQSSAAAALLIIISVVILMLVTAI